MQTIAVVSAKGGVGKSTFCTEVGKGLAARRKQVLLVDMDIGVRSLDLLLGVAEKVVYNWGDVLLGNCDVRKALLRAPCGVWLLPAPLRFSDGFTAEAFAALLEPLKKDCDFMLLDSPAGMETGFRLSAACAESCVFVTTPDAVSVRAAANAARTVRGMTDATLLLAVNRYDKKVHRAFCADDTVDTVGARLVGVVPECDAVYAAAGGGYVSPESKGGAAFRRIARRLCGEQVPFRMKLL